MRRPRRAQTIQARYCLAAMLVAWYWQPGLGTLLRPLQQSEWYWPNLIYQYYAQIAIAIFIVLAAWFMRLNAGRLFGPIPERRHIPSILIVVGLTFSASMVIVSLTYVPLSYVLPEFIEWWIRWYFQPVVYLASDGSRPFVPNLLNFISLVVLAPLLEEILFRRYLLHRWSQKWGVPTGIVLSSALFGMVHPDTLSAAATGLGFALLYVKTRTLWAPIIAHAIYNSIVWIWDFVGVSRYGFDYYSYGIDQFRADWGYGLLGAVVFVLLLDRVLRQKRPLGAFALPP